jgi:hypothetical protein
VCLIGVCNCRSLTAGNNYAVFEKLNGSLDCALVKADNILHGAVFAALRQQHLDCVDLEPQACTP